MRQWIAKQGRDIASLPEWFWVGVALALLVALVRAWKGV